MAMSPRLLRPLATGFNPKSIAGLITWIDFADTAAVTLDGSNKISAVTDKSGSGYNGTQTTSGNRLGVSTLNGRQCADGGTEAHSLAVRYTHLPGATLNYQEGYFAGIWDAGGSTFPTYNGIMSGASVTGSGVGAFVIGQVNVNGFNASGTFTRSIDGGSVIAINNTSAANGAISPFPAITSAFVMRGFANNSVGVNGWTIGTDRAEAGRGWLGRIGEVMFFNRVLASSEALKVRRYLAIKWGAPAQT
jgi:hypothetical protein